MKDNFYHVPCYCFLFKELDQALTSYVNINCPIKSPVCPADKVLFGRINDLSRDFSIEITKNIRIRHQHLIVTEHGRHLRKCSL